MSDSVLRAALNLQLRAAREGFDWDRLEELWDKLQEEIAELQSAGESPERRREELGDLLFMAVNLARHLGIDPDAALEHANEKFERRFRHVMSHAAQLPPRGDPSRLEAMETLWQQAKALEK